MGYLKGGGTADIRGFGVGTTYRLPVRSKSAVAAAIVFRPIGKEIGGMGLSDIAAGIEITERQEERGVPTVDATQSDLVSRLSAHAEALPCTPEAAATVLKTHSTGTSVGDSAREAGVAPMTAAKVLHRCGVAGVSPLAPTARRVVRDWLSGDVSRADALALSGADEAEFALQAYIETHDAVPELADAVEGVLEPEANASVAKRDALGETMSSVRDLR
jgi:hypothetical protein